MIEDMAEDMGMVKISLDVCQKHAGVHASGAGRGTHPEKE